MTENTQSNGFEKEAGVQINMESSRSLITGKEIFDKHFLILKQRIKERNIELKQFSIPFLDYIEFIKSIQSKLQSLNSELAIQQLYIPFKRQNDEIVNYGQNFADIIRNKSVVKFLKEEFRFSIGSWLFQSLNYLKEKT